MWWEKKNKFKFWEKKEPIILLTLLNLISNKNSRNWDQTLTWSSKDKFKQTLKKWVFVGSWSSRANKWKSTKNKSRNLDFYSKPRKSSMKSSKKFTHKPSKSMQRSGSIMKHRAGKYTKICRTDKNIVWVQRIPRTQRITLNKNL